MGKYPILKPREVASVLETLGFVEVRRRGSHKQYRHPDGTKTVDERNLTNCIQPTVKSAAADAEALGDFKQGEGHMDREESLRTHLGKLLNWEDAHVSFDAAVKGIPPALRGIVPERLPYSPWQLLEHLRLTQRDILEFCRNPRYVEPSPQEYWPASAVPPTAAVWDESVTGFFRDREALKRLAADPAVDLFECIPHGTGQTYLRELLLVADH